jgi:hypothetical protein
VPASTHDVEADLGKLASWFRPTGRRPDRPGQTAVVAATSVSDAGGMSQAAATISATRRPEVDRARRCTVGPGGAASARRQLGGSHRARGPNPWRRTAPPAPSSRRTASRDGGRRGVDPDARLHDRRRAERPPRRPAPRPARRAQASSVPSLRWRPTIDAGVDQPRARSQPRGLHATIDAPRARRRSGQRRGCAGARPRDRVVRRPKGHQCSLRSGPPTPRRDRRGSG